MPPYFLAAVAMQPLLVLAAGVAFVVLAIAWLRMPAFFALVLAATGVGLMSGDLPGDTETPHWINALNLPMVELGNTCGAIALPIALAAVIGTCMMRSGAADRIVHWLLQALGETRAASALLASGFLLSIPVFFDTVFFLLVPLAAALARSVGRHFVWFILAICGGAVLTHSLVPPTPGPLIMAERLGVDLGVTIVAGLAVAAVPAALALAIARWIDGRCPLPVPSTFQGRMRETAELPPIAISILPILLPVMLIAAASIVDIANGPDVPPPVAVSFLGHKNVAMLIGAIAAVGLVAREGRSGVGSLVAEPFQTAGVIILITSAGGAFGAMIKHSGVPQAVVHLADGTAINFIILGWIVSAVLKIAQGSGTVAMIVTAEMMAAMVGDPTQLPYHPVYILLAIGFGSFALSWMNDSAFWIVGRLSGFSEKQTLKTWTLLLSILSLGGFLLVLIASRFLPFALAT